MNYTKIKQKTIVTQVMERIREFIVSGKVKPGDRLPTEAELAHIFGVGRSSIREAVKVFNYLGVLESQTRKGTVLCDHSRISSEALTWSFLLGKKELGDLLDLRKAIEQECWLMLLMFRQTEPERFTKILDLLSEKITLMDEAYTAMDDEVLTETDYNFHLSVVEATANHQFLVLFQTLRAFTRAEINASNSRRKRSRKIILEHKELVEALEEGDFDNLLKLFRIHIDNAKNRILEYPLSVD